MINAGSIEELSLDKACISIGSFDGIHLGHQKLIAELRDSAIQHNAPSVVLTFYPHPAVVLKGINAPFYLSTPQEKAEYLSRLGVDVLISMPFTTSLANMTPDEFMKLLARHTGLKEMVVGCGFTLGKDRAGNVDTLSEIGKSLGYTMHCISPEISSSEIISSSSIRKMLEQGDVQSAAISLGRFYEVQGKVVEGDGRGRTIGFPTANMETWPEKLLPAIGVYRCTTVVDGKTYLCVGNVGYRPTFTENTKRVFVEIHLLDFAGDLYGKELQVQFTHRLRGEVKFPSFEELIQQIHRDIQTAREL
jgi:riboflavin kinase / FMN adenylyltransferase